VPARIVLLVTSPRLPAGLLTAAAWDVVREFPVFAAAETGQSEALRTAGCDLTVTGDPVAALLGAAADTGGAVWLAGPGGDEAMARDLGMRLAREPRLAELELMYGSWDPPGARLLDAVTVTDRLSGPDGDPWRRTQTHRSLARYMLEEAYEAYDAIDSGDLDSLREELGDVLLQVVLHARMAQDLPEGEAWSIDDVAGGLVDKMIRRNPHVFAGGDAETVDEITEQWERIKAAEKAGTDPMASIARSQPALSLAAEVQERAARIGLDPESALAATAGGSAATDEAQESGRALAARLWRVVAAAGESGLNPEAELRRVALAVAEHAAAESGPNR